MKKTTRLMLNGGHLICKIQLKIEVYTYTGIALSLIKMIW